MGINEKIKKNFLGHEKYIRTRRQYMKTHQIHQDY